MSTLLNINPRLTALPDGSVLAVNPSRRPNVGVVGHNEADARQAFGRALERREILIREARREAAGLVDRHSLANVVDELRDRVLRTPDQSGRGADADALADGLDDLGSFGGGKLVHTPILTVGYDTYAPETDRRAK